MASVEILVCHSSRGKTPQVDFEGVTEVAVANGTLEATLKDLDLIDKLFSDATNFNYFTSPIVSLEEKRALIDDVIASGKLQIHVCNFLNILIESKQIDLIKEIVEEFELVYNKLTEIELAVVSSVVKLISVMRERLKRDRDRK